MKNLALATVAVAVLLVTATADAQQAGPRGGAPDQERWAAAGRRMQEAHLKALASLNLTERQKADIALLDRKRDADMRALRERSRSGVREAMRAQARSIQEAYRKGLQTTLTPQQWEAYQSSLREARRDAAQNRRGARGKPKAGSGSKPGKP